MSSRLGLRRSLVGTHPALEPLGFGPCQLQALCYILETVALFNGPRSLNHLPGVVLGGTLQGSGHR